MLAKYLKLIKGGKDQSEPTAPPTIVAAGMNQLKVTEVPEHPDTPLPIQHEGERIVDTGSADGEKIVTHVLSVATHGKRTKAPEMLKRFLGRQPVLDASYKLVGYELKLRNKGTSGNALSETMQHMLDEMLLVSVADLEYFQALGQKLTFIGISLRNLGNPVLTELPKSVVYAIRLEEEALEETLQHCQALVAAGYHILLDDFEYRPEYAPFIRLARYVRIDTWSQDALALGEQAVEILKHGSPTLIANHVETDEVFEACKKLSFNLFQGYHFTRMQPTQPNRVDASRIRVMELLNMAMNHAEISQLEEKLKLDAVLSYKLINYINSPANGLPQKIRSIAHALVMMGYDQLYRWLTLLLFVSGKPDARSQALLKNALVRARLTEMLGRPRLPHDQQEGLFIVGIFSLLDALLNLPMDQVISRMNLPDLVVQALLKREGVYGPYLELAIACEDFDQDLITTYATACGMTPDEVNIAHVKALIWAEEVGE